MKTKAKYVIFITILVVLLMSITLAVSATTSFEVTDVNVTVTGTKAEVEWSKTEDADKYEVYIDLPNIGYLHVGSVKSNKVQIIGFEEGKIYGVKIKAYKNDNGRIVKSDFSEEVRFEIGENEKVTSKIGSVKNIEAISLGETGTLSWDKAENATGYDVYASIGNSDFINIGSTQTTKVQVIGMDPDLVYSIKIKPYLKQGTEKIYGSFSDLAILKYDDNKNTNVSKVYNLKVSMNGNKANITWNTVSVAVGYQVIVRMPGGTEATYYSDDNDMSLSGFTEDETYTVKVRAYKYVNGKKYYGSYSTSKSIRYENEKLAKVTGLKVTMNGDRASFKWNKVTGADGYEIYIYTPGYGVSRYNNISTSRQMSGFNVTDEYYTVKVRAYEYVNGRKVYGDYSSQVYFRNQDIEVDKVEGINVTVIGTKATLKWDKVYGADGYEIKLNVPNYGIYTYTTTGTSKTITGVTNRTSFYTARVRAYEYVNGRKVYGDYSNEVGFRRADIDVDRVTGLRVRRTGQAAQFTWNKVSGADGYEIAVNIPGIGECTYIETSNSRYMTGFTETRYKYQIRVRAFKNVNDERVYGDYSYQVSF